jgi:hypothetical protein
MLKFMCKQIDRLFLPTRTSARARASRHLGLLPLRGPKRRSGKFARIGNAKSANVRSSRVSINAAATTSREEFNWQRSPGAADPAGVFHILAS